MSQPAWLLYKESKLVASVRAATKPEARSLFRKAGLRGNRIIRAPQPNKGEVD